MDISCYKLGISYMNDKLLKTSGIVILLLCTSLISGCDEAGFEKVPEVSDIPSDTINASYIMDDGRSYSISGRGDAIPDEQLEYRLNIINNDEPWHLEYYVFLVDSESVIQEVCHDIYDIQSQGGTDKPFQVTIPESFNGAIGLYFIIPQESTFIVKISDGITAGWPDLSDYQ
jgi:hypothetical protein